MLPSLRALSLPLTLLLTTAIAATGCGRLRRPDEPKRGLPFTADASYFSATNGFKVFVLPDDGAQIVRVEVRLAAGAAQDPPGKEGLAHLIEHMMFQTKLPTDAGEAGSIAGAEPVNDFETARGRI